MTGASGPIKQGTGTLTLSVPNTYAGATDVQAGVLAITDSAALGATSGATTVETGAALDVSGPITVAEPITLNGDGVSAGTGALRHSDASDATISGGITLGSAARINNTSTTNALTFTGDFTGAAQNLTVGGGGKTTISGTIIGLTSGVLSVDGSGTVLTLNNLDNTSFSGPINVTGGATLSYPLGQSNDIKSAIPGFTDTGRSSVGYTGLVTLDNGTLLDTEPSSAMSLSGLIDFMLPSNATISPQGKRNVVLNAGGGTWTWTTGTVSTGGSASFLIYGNGTNDTPAVTFLRHWRTHDSNRRLDVFWHGRRLHLYRAHACHRWPAPGLALQRTACPSARR